VTEMSYRPLGDSGLMVSAVGIGCNAFGRRVDLDGVRAILDAAQDAGVTLLDTADAYCLDASEAGHNERLIARSLATWAGDVSRIRVATKGGLVRPGGRWEPDGRGRHLREACEASLRALGTERIHLYQIHASRWPRASARWRRCSAKGSSSTSASATCPWGSCVKRGRLPRSQRCRSS
jgi:aryl-alcohol dehydrogenase-like predicted oxidoreductase